MAKKKLTSFVLFDEFTQVPEEVWELARQELKEHLPRVRRSSKCPCGSGKPFGECCQGVWSPWDAVLDDDRRATVWGPPTMGILSNEEMREAYTHVARAERVFDLTIRDSQVDLPPLADDLYDVELGLLAMLALDVAEDGYAREALLRLGQRREIDSGVNYAGVISAFDELAETPAQGKAFERCVERLLGLAGESMPGLTHDIRRQLAQHLARVGRDPEALQVLEGLIQDDPFSVASYAMIGSIYLDGGDDERGVANLKRAFELAIVQSDVEAVMSLGGVLLDLGIMTEEALEKALEFAAEERGSERVWDAETQEAVLSNHPEYAPLFEGRDDELVPRPGDPDPILHIAQHSLVEQMIRTDEFPQVNEALLRLTSKGMPRHDAVHRIGELLIETMLGPMAQDLGQQRADILRKVDQLGR